MTDEEIIVDTFSSMLRNGELAVGKGTVYASVGGKKYAFSVENDEEGAAQ